MNSIPLCLVVSTGDLIEPSLGDSRLFACLHIITKLHKTDFFAWTQEQSALVRAKRWSEINVGHLAEEVEDMGKSERRSLESCLEVLLMYLLKWQVQKDRRSNSWRRTILSVRDSRLSQRNRLG